MATHRGASTGPSHARALLDRLERVTERGGGHYMARCPAHDDSNPSLSVREVDDRVLVHCFAGCSAGAIVAVVPPKTLRSDLVVLTSTGDERFKVGKVQLDGFSGVFFIEVDNDLIPLDTDSVIGVPVGFCLFDGASSQFIKFERLVFKG